MRPYLVLCGVVLIASAALGQYGRPPLPTYGYGYGPYAPFLTTPMISLETVSPNPVGASNATTGLVAGATDSTLSQLQGSTSSSYTVAVWYQGGAPLTTPEVNITPEPIGHRLHPMHHAMYEAQGAPEHPREEAKAQWMYFSGSEGTTDLGSIAKGPGKGHSYTNSDVTRQNDKNGTVHYDGKNEKIQ
jgi:hypothetical protein